MINSIEMQKGILQQILVFYVKLHNSFVNRFNYDCPSIHIIANPFQSAFLNAKCSFTFSWHDAELYTQFTSIIIPRTFHAKLV